MWRSTLAMSPWYEESSASKICRFRCDRSPLVSMVGGPGAPRFLEGVALVEQGPALAPGQEQDGMVPQLVDDLGLDQVVLEVGVALEGPAGLGRAAAREADAGLGHPLRGEDPVEPVERALVERRVVLERALQAADQGRLGAAVRAVQQDQAVGAPLPGEVRDQAVDGALDLLLADQVVLALVPGAVEQLPAGDRAARRSHRFRSEVIQGIPHVLGGRAGLSDDVGAEQREVLGERHHPTLAGERLAELRRRLTEPHLGIEGTRIGH